MAGIWPVIPFDLETLPSLLGRPGVVGDDGDPAQWLEARRYRGRRDLDDTLDTGDRQRVFGVKGFDLAAIYRAALDGGIFHTRDNHVDAIGRPAADDVLEVDNRVRFADISPVLPFFQLHLARRWHPHRPPPLS